MFWFRYRSIHCAMQIKLRKLEIINIDHFVKCELFISTKMVLKYVSFFFLTMRESKSSGKMKKSINFLYKNLRSCTDFAFSKFFIVHWEFLVEKWTDPLHSFLSEPYSYCSLIIARDKNGGHVSKLLIVRMNYVWIELNWIMDSTNRCNN